MKHVDFSTESGDAVPQFLDDRLDQFHTGVIFSWQMNFFIIV